ncbi:metalloproteinase inhibitor 3-like [Saccostrea cucullata]|uniref:metalloproteinase inhibitor 3-like n=1 Tax=Saccostrea cuccullata TaxID=36930 RepID=UPI002ED139E8
MNETCVPSKYKMKTMAFFSLVFIAFLVQLYGADACLCEFTDLQNKYCKSDFAVRGKVTKLTYGEGIIGIDAEITYEVEISKVYKGAKKGETVQIRTAGSGSLCGVGLTLDKEYLINGYFYEGHMWINLCDMMFFSPVDGKNADFPRLSDEDCKCKIENILVNVGGQKPKMVCAIGNRVLCSSDSGSPGNLAECKYSSNKDDCDWDC